MANVMLRTDLRTACGEVCDILFKNRFVGTLTLVYRESDRIAGALQLEKEVLKASEKDEVCDHVHWYVQSLIDAMQAVDCEVMVTYSTFDHVIATEETRTGLHALDNAEEDFDYDTDWIDTETRVEDESLLERNEYLMSDLELFLVGEDENTMEYHIYDLEDHWLAEAFLRIDEREVTGTVNWMVEPTDSELDTAADLLVLQFDDEQIDSFAINMEFDHELIETIELTHEDLFQEEEEDNELIFEPGDGANYSIVLVRDDGDVLTYEIYQPSYGGLPIGTATIDISQRQLTGFIDFRDLGGPDDRELIATLLMQELDKEKEYDTINLTMMHRNRLIEEIMFETERVH